MSFEDFAARMKARRDTTEESAGEQVYDFEESYRIRAKMLGVLLRDARQSAARTIEDCARLLNVMPDLIERWEYGEQVPALPQLETTGLLFGCPD